VLFKSLLPDLNKKVALYVSMLGFVILALGTTLIIIDLTTFQAGVAEFNVDKFFRFMQFFLHFKPNSMMSIGSWLVGGTIITSALFVIAIFKNHKFVAKLAVINSILSVCVASYTALLLGDIAHNFVWSNSILVVLFMVSSLSSGIAVLMIIKSLLCVPYDGNHGLEKKDVFVLGFELLLVAIFSYSVMSLSTYHHLNYVLSTEFLAGKLWWFGAIIIGILIPLTLNINIIFNRRTPSHNSHYLIAAAILVGAFCLRYAVLLAGQYS
jgi:formate-dependent nitrite reductase membrane component NrfD